MNNFERQLYYWTHMLDEAYDKSNFLTEGMHWPKDYAEKAISRIKASPLGQQSWYSDNYIKTDVDNIIADFSPLSHDSKNLGYFLVIIRWFIEYSGTSKQKYQEFLETFLSRIVKTLLIVSKDNKLTTQYKDKIKQMPFDEFQKIQDNIDKNAKAVDLNDIKKKKFVIMPIDSYEQMNSLFGGDKTGAGIANKGWCHTNGQSTYNSWISKKYEKFFVIAAEDWKSCKPDIAGNNAYDDYGLSLMAVKVKFIQPLSLVNVTLRYNHVVVPADKAVDNAFDSFNDLSKVAGFDVKKTIEDYQKQNKLKSFSKFEPDDNGNISLDEDVTSLEGAPKEVRGDFYCNGTKITSLEGAPQKVGGDFRCDGTKITSLKGAPQKVGGDFICCYTTKITSLEGAPKEVGAGFYCNGTKITSLEGAPQKVGGSFDCGSTKITSLKGAPQKVGGDFRCNGTKITSLEGAPQKVGGSFDCGSTKITSLKGAPQKVGGDFRCYTTKITSLEGAPQEVGRDFYCSVTKITSLKGAPTKVGGYFYCDGVKITQEQIDAYKAFLKNPTPEHIDDTGHYKP